MMENRILPVAVVFAIAFALMIFVLGTLVIVFRPSMIWGSEQRLLNSVESGFPFYYSILTNEEGQRLDQNGRTNEHVFTLNSVHRHTDNSISIVCFVHSTQTPSLTAFSDGIDRSKSVGAIHLTDSVGFEYVPIHGSSLAFSTDVVDTVSWFTCFEDIPADREEFLLILGQSGIPEKYAEFSITIPQ